MTWMLKSESDTDTVYVEVDEEGVETGNYKYLEKDVPIAPLAALNSSAIDVVPASPRRRLPTIAAAALSGGLAALAVEVVSRHL